MWRLIPFNPAQGIALPSKRGTRRAAAAAAATEAEDVRKLRTLSAEQVHALLASTADRESPFHPLFYLLLHSSLRPSEALALKWSDVDGDQLTVQRSFTKVSAGRWELVPVGKTRSAFRRFKLTREEVTVLEAHRKRQRRAILKAGESDRRADFIFATRTGTPLNLGNVYHKWRAELEAAKLPRFRLYDARHTAATLMLQAGVHPKAVSVRLGHSAVQVTLDTYSHVMPEVDAEAADKLSAFLAARRAAAAGEAC